MKSRFLACAAALGLSIAPITSADAFLLGGIVYDPTNYAQNLLTAARTLEMINNQIKQLTNEAQMIASQAKELTNLSYSAKAAIASRLAQIDNLIKTANGVAYDVTAVDAAFKTYFPEDYSAFSNAAMGAAARQHWKETSRAFHDAMLIQAQVAETVRDDTATLDTLVQESQSAVGGLQAAQAGNQLIALQTKQSMQTAQLLAVQYRAEALDRARQLQTEERARIHRGRFLGDGAAYTPS
ncbi:MAG: P-type conjugative transfer protein TrbJ [Oricola sp.]|nr:P-type conjugative transfer protein TrbJ [Oricola sp.]